jgi:hypothetical protein
VGVTVRQSNRMIDTVVDDVDVVEVMERSE